MGRLSASHWIKFIVADPPTMAGLAGLAVVDRMAAAGLAVVEKKRGRELSSAWVHGYMTAATAGCLQGLSRRVAWDEKAEMGLLAALSSANLIYFTVVILYLFLFSIYYGMD